MPRIASIQNLYNLTARHFETSLLDETCHRENVGLLAYSPLAFGQLTAKYLDDPQAKGRLTLFPAGWSPRYVRPATIAAASQYAALARAHGLTPAQLALAWCYSRWFVASTIIGATSVAAAAAKYRCPSSHPVAGTGGGRRRHPRQSAQSGAVGMRRQACNVHSL